jgi:hypothetical protein
MPGEYLFQGSVGARKHSSRELSLAADRQDRQAALGGASLVEGALATTTWVHGSAVLPVYNKWPGLKCLSESPCSLSAPCPGAVHTVQRPGQGNSKHRCSS